MEDGQAVVADSTSETPAAPSAAAASTDVTHGEQTEQAADTETLETPTSPDAGDDDEHDPETEPAEGDTPEEAKSKAQKRRERRIQREQERIDKAVAEAIATRDREASEAAEAAEREAAAKKAREESDKRFAEYRGEPGEVDRLQGEIADLNRQIRAEVANPNGADLDALEAQVSAKEARLTSITTAQGFEGALREEIWNGIEAQILRPLAWSELADPAARQRFLTSSGGIAGALDVAKDILVSATEARKDAQIAEINKAHASKVATLESELRTWRVRAGAEEVPDTTSGGQATTSNGLYTRERLRQLMQTPEGMAEYRRNRAEIERQEAAGLIR